ncbi:pentatricopeptide repeat-containing protein At1g12775, mitochondrial-like [Impatiens glandulifera]|uniref:pentatricopeptide repeat-containing protein At1g12775, mitochondrial-like n=1 Tax=Impatiens glandulifera TaxID=253017 RepID=UPI001FB07B24|nr:pentatricopeptide repeat-containing protein At1g12775, mitochondrial-like [Impatiens glandulifera]
MNHSQLGKFILEISKSKLGFPKLDDALSLFNQMVRMRPLPPVIRFNQLLRALFRMKEYSVSISLFKDMCFKGLPTDQYTMSTAMNCFCRLKQVNAGSTILGFLIKRRYIIDSTFFNILINGLILEGRTAEAIDLFKKLVIEEDVDSKTYNEITFGIAIKALCKSNNSKGAVELLNNMHNYGCKPNLVAYNTLIDSLCKDGFLDDAFILLSQMKSREEEEGIITPDVITYTCLISGLCNVGRWDDAKTTFLEMNNEGISPNDVTFSILVNALCKEGNMKAAQEIMMKCGHCRNVFTYTTLIDGYITQGEMGKALQLLTSMIKDGIEPNIVTYGTLIHGYTTVRLKLDKALHLFRQMSSKGLKPNIQIYNILIQGLFYSGNCFLARKLWKELHVSGLRPDICTYRVLLNGLCRNGFHTEALSFFLEMKTVETMSLDIQCHGIIVNMFCKEGRMVRGFLQHNEFGEVMRFLKEMFSKGFSLDVTTLQLFVNLLSADRIDDDYDNVVIQDLFKVLIDTDISEIWSCQ